MDASYQLIENSLWFISTEIIPVVAMVIVLVLFSIQLSRIQAKVRGLQMDKPVLKIGKLYVFLAVFSIFTLLWVAVGVFEFQIFYYVQIFMLLFIFVFGYMSYFVLTLFDPPNILSGRALEISESKHNDTEELKRLKHLFESDKIYLEQKLTLKMVAQEVQLPQNYVSGLINAYHNTNFNAFVNQYRVEEVKNKLKDPKEKNKTLLAIALDSGFSSKSSFNKTFKEVTGKNPSEYLKK